MNRTIVIWVTAGSAVLCGCPGLVLVVLGALAALGTQVPEAMAGNASTPEEVLLGAGMFACFGGVLILIPIIVGVLSIGLAKNSEPAINEQMPPGPG